MPYGLFGAKRSVGERARAVLSGRVQSVARLRNELTGAEFVHTRLHTFGGPIDIVAPAAETPVPEQVTLAFADCWLVGQPGEAPPPPATFFRRLLGRR